MNTNQKQFVLDVYGNYSTIDKDLIPLIANNSFRSNQGANLLRGR